MIDALITNPTMRLLEQSLNFTEQRHQVILENLANVSTPGYVQKDVSVKAFEKAMQDAVDQQRQSFNTAFDPQSNDAVEFVPGSSHVTVKPAATTGAMAFHDRGVRSIEALQADLADNATAHNTISQMLKTRYDWISKAINLKP